MNKKLLCVLVLASSFLVAGVQAANKDDQATWKPRIDASSITKRLKIHGFVSAGASMANSNGGYGIPNYGTVTKDFDFAPNSLAGLQFSAAITPQLSTVIQLVANGSNRAGNRAYQIRSEWAFVRYAFQNNWQLRAGRFRLPAFLYSDTSEVGYSYPWIWLPNEVYRIVPFSNFNAVDATISKPLGNSGWTAQVEPFLGSNQSNFDVYNDTVNAIVAAPLPSPGYNTLKFRENNILGAVITMSNPYITLRANYIHINATAYLPNNPVLPPGISVSDLNPGPNGQLGSANQPAYFYSFSGRVNVHHLLAVAEFAQRRAFSGVASLTGYYGTLGYRYGQWMPNATYGHLQTFDQADVSGQALNPFSERAQAQESINVGLNYYVNSNLVLKSSVYRIVPLGGTYGLFDYNYGHSPVYLYALGLSAIF